jgi:hypothetical protein
MTTVIIVDKHGKPKSATISSAEELYKKCGFKTDKGFALAHTWTLVFNDVEYKLDVYGKTDGKAGSENKYEFPPPIDNTLFFGSCAVIGRADDKYISISVSEFNDIMEHLQGGYSDLEEESDESEESDELNMPKTKEGYVKDGFIASDSNEDEEEEEEEEEEIVVKPKRGRAKTGGSSAKTVAKTGGSSAKTGGSSAKTGTEEKKTKPSAKKKKEKEEPVYAVYVEELTEDPYFE